MSLLGGAAIGMGATGLAALAVDPYLRATMIAEAKMKMSKSQSDKYTYKANFTPPPAAVSRAEAVAKYLEGRGFNPQKHNIAISATGGTGKSTMARILADRLNMTYTGERTSLPEGFEALKNKRGELSGREYAKAVGQAETIPRGTVYEQTHLLPLADPDRFDAMIYLRRDADAIHRDLLKRKRAAALRHFVDYPLLDNVIRQSFEQSAGRDYSPEEGVRIKMKPKGGFKANQKMSVSLRAMGYKQPEIDAMGREDKLYAIAGEPGRMGNILSKHISPEYNARSVASALSILGGGALAGALIGARR